MNLIKFSLRWGWFLGLALLAPVSLPAGGAQRIHSTVRRRYISEPFLILSSCSMLSSPLSEAPRLKKLDIGTPVRVLRCWKNIDGSNWLHVQINSSEFLPAFSNVQRGWLNI